MNDQAAAGTATLTTSEDTADRPASPAAAIVAVLTAMFTGAAAVGLSTATDLNALKLVLAIALIVAGAVLAGRAAALHSHAATVLGRPVLRGIGGSAVVLGGYLTGATLLAMSISQPTLSDPDGSVPSPVVAVLLLYGVPLLALLSVLRGRPVWAVGAAAGTVVLVASLLAAAEAPITTILLTMLAIAVVSAIVVLAVRTDATWTGLVTVAGAMAASFAFGAGVSPFGSLGAAQSQLSGTAAQGEETIPVVVSAAALAATVLAAATLLGVSTARRDVAGGVIAGSVFLVPLYSNQLAPWTGPAPTSVKVTYTVVLAAVAVLAVAAFLMPAMRRMLAGVPGVWRRTRFAVSARTLVLVGLTALAVFLIQVASTFDLPAQLRGGLVLLVLAGLLALALTTSGLPGVAAAVVALLGLRAGWWWSTSLIRGDTEQGENPFTLEWLIAIVDLGTAGVVAWLLLRRHRRPAVAGAASFALAGSLAHVLFAALLAPDMSSGTYGYHGGVLAVVILAAPLVILGVLAAVAALRGDANTTAMGQAAGAVLMVIGGLVPLGLMTSMLGGGNELAVRASLAPFTPTDWGATWALHLDAAAIVGIVVVLLLGLVLLSSVVRRPSAPLTAAVALLMLGGVQGLLLTVLDTASADAAEGLAWGLAGGAAVLVVLAVVVSHVARPPLAATVTITRGAEDGQT